MVKTWGRDLLEAAQVLVLGKKYNWLQQLRQVLEAYHEKQEKQNQWNLCHHVDYGAGI